MGARAWARGIAVGALMPAMAMAVAASGLSAQQTPPGVERTPDGIRLDFQRAELRLVVTALADLAELNVLFSDIPDRQVTLRTTRPASTEELRGYLESIAETHELTITEENGLVRIAGGDPESESRAATPTPLPAERDTGTVPRLFVYHLRHARAESLAATLGALFGTGATGAFTDDAPLSLTERLRGDRLAFAPTDGGAGGTPGSRAADGEGADPGDAGDSTGARAGLEGPVQIVPDARTNALLVRAAPADYTTIRAAIEELDTRPLQVLIEVLIAEVRRDRQRGLGVGIDVPDQEDSETGLTLGGRLLGSGGGDVVLDVLGIGGVGADATLRALNASSDVTILSRPVVLAQNNQEARILVGTQRPFVQLFRALPTDDAVRDQVVQYRDVGTQLVIRPTINPDGYVTLSVLQEVSTATAETQFGAPVISTREAQTELLVRDGGTVAIGGLVDRQRDGTRSGIPILRDIPLVGGLFGSSSDRDVVTELFLFITPHVLRTDGDIREATDGLRDGTEHLDERIGDDFLLLPVPDSLRPPPDTTAAAPDTTAATTGASAPGDSGG